MSRRRCGVKTGGVKKNLSPKGTAIVHRKNELSKVENEREAGG